MKPGAVVTYGKFHNGVHDQEFVLRQCEGFLEWFERGHRIEPGLYDEFSTGVRGQDLAEAIAAGQAEWPRLKLGPGPT